MSSARADSCSLCSVKGPAPQHLPQTNLCFGHGSCRIFSDLRCHEPFLERRDFVSLVSRSRAVSVSFTSRDLSHAQARTCTGMHRPAEPGSTASDPAPMLALTDVTKWELR